MRLLGGFRGTIHSGTSVWVDSPLGMIPDLFPVDFTTFFFYRASGFVSFVYNGTSYYAKPEVITRI